MRCGVAYVGPGHLQRVYFYLAALSPAARFPASSKKGPSLIPIPNMLPRGQPRWEQPQREGAQHWRPTSCFPPPHLPGFCFPKRFDRSQQSHAYRPCSLLIPALRLCDSFLCSLGKYLLFHSVVTVTDCRMLPARTAARGVQCRMLTFYSKSRESFPPLSLFRSFSVFLSHLMRVAHVQAGRDRHE